MPKEALGFILTYLGLEPLQSLALSVFYGDYFPDYKKLKDEIKKLKKEKLIISNPTKNNYYKAIADETKQQAETKKTINQKTIQEVEEYQGKQVNQVIPLEKIINDYKMIHN